MELLQARIAKPGRPISTSEGLFDERSQGDRRIDHRVFHQPVRGRAREIARPERKAMIGRGRFKRRRNYRVMIQLRWGLRSTCIGCIAGAFLNLWMVSMSKILQGYHHLIVKCTYL